MTEQRGTAVATRDDWLAQIVGGMNREDRLTQLHDLLGSDAAVARFKTVALHAIVNNQTQLAECTPISIIEAVREAAALGLEPTGVLGEAWILPYRNVARLQVGYRGYLKLIRQSGQVPFVDAQVVYMNDRFYVQQGTAPRIDHEPLIFGERDEANELVQERGNYRGAYAWAELAGTTHPLIDWMPLVEIEKARLASPAVRAGRKTPWDDWYGEMARKTPSRRLSKRLPLSPLAARALAYEEESDDIEAKVYGEAQRTVHAMPARQAAMAALESRFGEADGQTAEAPEQGVGATTSAQIESASEDRSRSAQEASASVPEATPVPPRPAAPVDDDDDDLAAMIQATELGGEG